MSKLKIIHEYTWRELSEDGLLKSPRDLGPYYDSENINGYYGTFDSKEKAEIAYLEFYKKHPYNCSNTMVLITLSKIEED